MGNIWPTNWYCRWRWRARENLGRPSFMPSADQYRGGGAFLAGAVWFDRTDGVTRVSIE
ncbi:hypothetical protein ACLK17_20980 [Escherichia coli]